MGKKIDTEAIKKHQFWVGLGAFILLWVIAVVFVMMGGDTKAKEAWNTAKKAIDTASSSPPKTLAYQQPWTEYGEKFKKHKDTIWADAWNHQRSMYTWPEGMNVTPEYPDDPWGADASADANNRGRFREQYKTQFVGLEQVVAPVELTGGLEKISAPVTWTTKRVPSREEIWLAQEDFWVRRELLYMVRGALDAVAAFKEIKPDAKEKLPEGIVGSRRFRNANWELNLMFEQGKDSKRWLLSDKSTIKNVSPMQKTLPLAGARNKGGLMFRLWQGSGHFDLEVSGEPLPHEKETTFKPRNPNTSPVNPDKVFGVVQLLEWETSPVRKIEAIEVPYHSHRTQTAGLKIREDLKKLDPDQTESTDGSGQTGTPATPGMGMMGGMPSMPGPGLGKGMEGMDGKAKSGDLTKINAIDRSRYMLVQPQARHLPIAMKLIVEQAHIHDLLAAIVNSRLRIQVTQVSMHHVRSVVRGETSGEGGMGMGMEMGKGMGTGAGKKGGFPTPSGIKSGDQGRPMSIPMPGMGPGPGSLYRPMTPGMGEGGMGMGEQAATTQDNAKLVELTVYGVATLYERFPAKPKTEPAPGNTGS